MNEHEKTQSSLPQLIAGTLSPSEAIQVRSHLAECGECARQEQVWRGLARAMKRIPETTPTPVRLARIAALAQARREEVLEHRWNRLVLTGLVLYGWALFVVSVPLLPAGVKWLEMHLALPLPAVVILALIFWWSFCWVIGLALLPLLREQRADLEEKVV